MVHTYIIVFLSFPLVACAPGQYQSSTTEILSGPVLHAYHTCLPCSVGQYQPNEGQVECMHCEAGTYRNSIGSHTCKPCSRGHYQVEKGQTGCIPCEPGSYQPEKGQTGCIPCEPGSYQNDTGGTTCISCTVGRYQPDRGQPNCIACPDGFTTNRNSTQCIIKGENIVHNFLYMQLNLVTKYHKGPTVKGTTFS